MIVVRVELWSAITGDKTELARMHICNEGGTRTVGHYGVATFVGRTKEALDRLTPSHVGKVVGHRRLDLHIWNLVRKALEATGYTK